MAGNGGMQETRYEDAPVPMPAPCACTVGGNQQIVNGNEGTTLDRTWESMGTVAAPEGYREDDSHVMGAWKLQAADFSGS